MECSTKLKGLIVEDEEGPRLLLKRLLRRHSDVIEVVAEAHTGPEALEVCQAHRPDVIFLDLGLPGFGGFELLSQLRFEAHIIITTAAVEHAVYAYRTNAVDYLLKPVDPAQLSEAVSRVVSAISRERLTRLLCREHDSIKVVHLSDVLFLCSEDGYTKVQTQDAYFLMSEPLTAIEGRLPEHFVRTHRTTIVNIRHVMSLDKSVETAFLGQRFEVPISRRHQREFRRRLVFER